MITVHCISDLHGRLPKIPPGDMLIIAGDIVPLNKHAVESSATWLDFVFRPWLEAQPVQHIVAIWGNHDWIGERRAAIPDLPWVVLQDSETTLEFPATGEQLRVYGTPWTPMFNNWAFNLDDTRAVQSAEGKGRPTLTEKYRTIPSKRDRSTMVTSRILVKNALRRTMSH